MYAELLEILGSIINGFALPLKEEHKASGVAVVWGVKCGAIGKREFEGQAFVWGMVGC